MKIHSTQFLLNNIFKRNAKKKPTKRKNNSFLLSSIYKINWITKKSITIQAKKTNYF